MMRKLHRAALAAALKPALAALSPSFSLASTAWAKAFDSERRFTFSARVDASLAFLLFEPSATSRDSYFTVDLVWHRDGGRSRARARRRDGAAGHPAGGLAGVPGRTSSWLEAAVMPDRSVDTDTTLVLELSFALPILRLLRTQG